MAELIDGKRISTMIKDECKQKVEEYKAQGIEICLAVIQVGNNLREPLRVKRRIEQIPLRPVQELEALRDIVLMVAAELLAHLIQGVR